MFSYLNIQHIGSDTVTTANNISVKILVLKELVAHTCLRSWRPSSTVYSDGCLSSLGTRLGDPHSRFGELRQRTNLHSWLMHLPPPVPRQVLTVLLFAIQVSWPLGARLHRAPIFLFISLFSTDTQPTSQCVQKQETAGMGPLKKKKKKKQESSHLLNFYMCGFLHGY